jgi:hypothetical protein
MVQIEHLGYRRLPKDLRAIILSRAVQGQCRTRVRGGVAVDTGYEAWISYRYGYSMEYAYDSYVLCLYGRACIVQGEIPNIRIMYNDIEHSISIDFYIYISIFQVF